MEDFVIWRYIDFVKFEDLIKNSRLFFTFRKHFKDDIQACEGKPTKYTETQRLLSILHNIENSKNLCNPNASIKIVEFHNKKGEQKGKDEMLKTINNAVSKPNSSVYITSREYIKNRESIDKAALENFLNSIGISCWTMYNKYDSNMLQRFVRDVNNCVAIKTTVSNLLSTFPKIFPKENKINFGKIRYIDYNSETFEYTNFMNFLYYMDKAWESENEFRVTFDFGVYFDEWTYNECLINNNLEERNSIRTALGIGPLNYEQIKKMKAVRKSAIEEGFWIPINLTTLNMTVFCSSQDIFNKSKILLKEANISNVKLQMIESD